MPEAHVINVAAISDFRASLASFAVSARQAVVDLDLEVKRALDWVTRDRPAFWSNEVRKAHEAVARAKDDLANSRTYKRIGDFVPACLEEKKTLEIAKRRLEYVEKKLDTCKHWSMVVRRAVDEFQGPIQQLMGMLDGDIPQAMAVLDRMSMALEQYAATPTPAAVSWEELTGEGETSIACPTEDVKDVAKEEQPATPDENPALQPEEAKP
jgi:chaperonin cofactor prefoldin